MRVAYIVCEECSDAIGCVETVNGEFKTSYCESCKHGVSDKCLNSKVIVILKHVCFNCLYAIDPN